MGLEKTPEEYVAKMVEVFREVRRVLADDGILWLNLGDSYCGSWGNYSGQNRGAGRQRKITNGSKVSNPAYSGKEGWRPPNTNVAGLKPKDLVGIPWMLAFALRADGWWLRQDIIWFKKNPMPESVTDRCTKAHEYIFLMSKSKHYHFDNEAIREPLAEASIKRLSQENLFNQKGSNRVPGKTNGPMKAVMRIPSGWNTGLGDHRDLIGRYKPVRFGGDKAAGYGSRTKSGKPWEPDLAESVTRNKRSVWTVTTKPFKGAHFATFPMDLIEPCILAGKQGGVVLDPFMGAGTTGLAALKHGRRFVGIELNPEYAKMADDRIREYAKQQDLFS